MNDDEHMSINMNMFVSNSYFKVVFQVYLKYSFKTYEQK